MIPRVGERLTLLRPSPDHNNARHWKIDEIIHVQKEDGWSVIARLHSALGLEENSAEVVGGGQSGILQEPMCRRGDQHEEWQRQAHCEGKVQVGHDGWGRAAGAAPFLVPSRPFGAASGVAQDRFCVILPFASREGAKA